MTLDVIILFNGGFIPIVKISQAQKDGLFNVLSSCIEGTYTNSSLKIGDAVIKPSSIVGFYFRESADSPATKAVELMQKIVDQTDEGEDWKS